MHLLPISGSLASSQSALLFVWAKDLDAFLLNPHRTKSGNRPYATLPQGLFSDGWAPTHSAYKSFEAFYLTFLSQTTNSQASHSNLYTVTSNNRIPWHEMAPHVVGELQKLHEGIVSASSVHFFFFSSIFAFQSHLFSVQGVLCLSGEGGFCRRRPFYSLGRQ